MMLFDEGLGPILAVIGAEIMVLALIQLGVM
jgi:hypothetical protein